MSGNTNLTKLSQAQLIALVQVRGQALIFAAEEDDVFIRKIMDGEFTPSDFDDFYKAKNDNLASLATTEDKIIAGQMFTASN